MEQGDSPEWTKAAVLEQLGRAEGEPGLQAFLDRAIPTAEVDAVARAIVEAAGKGARIGPVSRMAKSFSVHGDVAALRRVAQDQRISSVLPSTIDDVWPKPVASQA